MKRERTEYGKEMVKENEGDNDNGESSVLFEKDSSGFVCLICDKIFQEKRALEQHIQAKNEQSDCPLCDEVFPLGTALVKHTDE